MGIGVLLPRDFLDRQPKRWQKSQRKRGAIKTLKRMKEKREKLEQKTLDHARRDSKYSSVEAAPAKQDLKPAPAAVRCRCVGGAPSTRVEEEALSS